MIDINTDIKKFDTVSSEDTRSSLEKMADGLSYQYHRILNMAGKINLLSTCLKLNNDAMASYITNTTDDNDSVTITAATTPTLPTSLTEENMKAERILEYGTIIAKRVTTKSVFTNNNGNKRSDLILASVSKNSLSLEAPDKIVANSLDHILDSNVPYIAKFVKDGGMSKANIIIRMISDGNDMPINALRIMPLPPMNNIMLDSVIYNLGYNLIQNGDVSFPEVSSYDFERTKPAYLHFNQINMRSLNISFTSEIYSADLGAIVIGVNKIVGELNIYSLESYIGYRIPFPDEATGITSVQVYPDCYSSSVDNITTRIYYNEGDYNEMNDNFNISFNALYNSFFPRYDAEYCYILVKFDVVNNTTPSIGKIKVEFQNV
jgi:hypothetical protein